MFGEFVMVVRFLQLLSVIFGIWWYYACGGGFVVGFLFGLLSYSGDLV